MGQSTLTPDQAYRLLQSLQALSAIESTDQFEARIVALEAAVSQIAIYVKGETMTEILPAARLPESKALPLELARREIAAFIVELERQRLEVVPQLPRRHRQKSLRPIAAPAWAMSFQTT
jgi:hypothetical protein